MAEAADILVVDDDPIMRELAAAHLTEAGHAVRMAPNGREALDMLAARPADLVISDIDMPELDGYGLTVGIRATKALASTPVIVITGSDHPGAVERAFAAGATSFLAKPVNWTLFGHAVRFVLRASANEQALRVARDQAEAGARFKDSLMSVMSHELRTPLNAIIGFGQLLSEQFEKDNDPVHREYAEYVVDGGKRLLNSVSDMLLASDARSGPIAINETDCALADIIELAIAANSKAAGLAGAEIRTVLQDPDLELLCDRQLLSRAVAKLIDNAVKFSQRGVRIVVGATLTRTGELAILVKDDGPGIDAEKLKTITQPFTQSDMSLRRSKEGLGLGLPLVQAIASAHRARFKLESKAGEGSRACIVIPAERLRRAAQPARRIA